CLSTVVVLSWADIVILDNARSGQYTMILPVTNLRAFVLWLLAVPAFAQSISADRMRADLQFLASDALEGRLSLRRGSEVAIQWIAAEFAKAGLNPVVGNSFLQEFALIEFRNDRAESCLILGKRREPVTSVFPDDVRLCAPVVFAGFGITAPEFGY